MEANKQILATPTPPPPTPPPTVRLHNSSPFVSLRPRSPSLALVLSPPSFYLSSDMQFLFLLPRLSCFFSKDKKQSRGNNSIIYYLHHVITGKKRHNASFFDDEQSVISPLVFASKKKSLLIKFKKIVFKNKK